MSVISAVSNYAQVAVLYAVAYAADKAIDPNNRVPYEPVANSSLWCPR